jgi:hypothetical protein
MKGHAFVESSVIDEFQTESDSIRQPGIPAAE